MKHTAAPWRLEPGTLRMVLARAFDGSEKAIVELVRGGTPEEAEANARLIAAAPDLLFALRELCRAWDERQLPVSDRMDAALADADAAIALAEGR